MSLIQSLILAFVQGLTEFLPISSDGHLNLVQYLFGFSPSLTFDIYLHLATFFSVIFFFRKRLSYFFSNIKYIFIGSIPVIVTGFFLKDYITTIFINPKLLPFFFLITALYTLFTKFIKKQDKKITYLSALIIGIFQALALLPGVSRSGGTIFSALLLGLSPINAFNFSFSLFIPATFGAILLEIKNILSLNILTLNNLVAFIVTFLVGLLALNFLEKALTSNRFWFFGIYTLILSLTLFFVL